MDSHNSFVISAGTRCDTTAQRQDAADVEKPTSVRYHRTHTSFNR